MGQELTRVAMRHWAARKAELKKVHCRTDIQFSESALLQRAAKFWTSPKLCLRLISHRQPPSSSCTTVYSTPRYSIGTAQSRESPKGDLATVPVNVCALCAFNANLDTDKIGSGSV